MAGPFQYSPGAGTTANMWAKAFEGLSQIPTAMVKGPFLQQEYDQNAEEIKKQQALRQALDLQNDASYMQSMEGLITDPESFISEEAYGRVPEQMRSAFAPREQGGYKIRRDYTLTPAQIPARQYVEGQTQNLELDNILKIAGIDTRGGRSGYDPFSPELYKFLLPLAVGESDAVNSPSDVIANPARAAAVDRALKFHRDWMSGVQPGMGGGMVQPGRQPRQRQLWNPLDTGGGVAR